MAGAGLAVVLAVGGLTTVLGDAGPGSSVTAAAASAGPVTSWAPRGSFVGDADLLSKARALWLQEAPADVTSMAGPVALYAGSAPGRELQPTVSATVVVLRDQDAAGHVTLGYITSPLLPTGTAPSGELVLRAHATVPFGQENIAAVGFMATTPDPADGALPSPTSFGFALTNPGVGATRFSTSIVDDEMSDSSATATDDGALTFLAPPEAGAWNTEVIIGSGDAAIHVPLAASDPETTTATVTPDSDGTLRVTGGTSRVGDLVSTHDGVLGTVVSADQNTMVVDPNLQHLGSLPGANPQTAVTSSPGLLTTSPDGSITFATTDPGYELKDGNRIVVSGYPTATTLLNLGHVSPGPDGTWTLRRSAPLPEGPTTVSVIAR